MKILWLFNHPAPYKVDFFNELGKSVDLTVIFERPSESDRGSSFYHSKPKNFKTVFLKHLNLGIRNNIAFGAKKYLKKHEEYDFIVINGWSSITEMGALRYLKRKKIPYVFAINGGIIPKKESNAKKRLKDKMIGGAAYYLCPDHESEKYLIHYGAKGGTIHLFPYSTVFEKEILSEPLKEEEKKRIKEELGVKEKEIYTAVGAFIERKNNLYLIDEIWKNVDSSKHLYLLGNGPLKNEYLEEISKNHLQNVHILPFQDKATVLKFLSISEASLFLTKEDIYGHVLNESLSQATPVIASDRSNSAKHLISQGENGYVFSLEQKDEIIAAINKPIDEGMRKNAIATAKENTIEKMSDNHLSFFSSIIKA